MLDKTLETKRLLLISPELLAILVITALLLKYPRFFESISLSTWGADGIPSLIVGLPFVLTGVAYKIGKTILRPGVDEEENKKLYEWPLYWALELRVYSSMLICAACAVAATIFYLKPFDWGASTYGAIFLGSLSISLIATFPIILGSMTIRKIMTMHG